MTTETLAVHSTASTPRQRGRKRDMTPRSWSVEREQRQEQAIALVLALMLFFSYVYTLPRWADPNQNSRLDMVFAVVENGTFRIDAYVGNTVDYAKVGEHYYSDKAPGIAFLGIPIYAGMKQVLDLPLWHRVTERLERNSALTATLREEGTGLLAHKVRFAAAQVVLTAVLAALPTALLGALMYISLRQFIPAIWPRVGVVLAYGLLTPAFAYAGALYGHQLSAACLFLAFYLFFQNQGSLQTGALIGAGVLMGYSVITEYPTLLIVVILFTYAFSRLKDKRRIGWVMLPGALIAAGWMTYNTAVFGGPLELGYAHSELWTEQHQTGFMSMTSPRWKSIWGITFSPFRGLFVLSPVMLLAIPGFILWYRSNEYRPEWIVALTSVGAMFLFNASSIMWWGGYAVGPRYILPMMPFLALPLIFVFRVWLGRIWLQILTGALAVWSLVATWGLTLAEQAFPPDTVRNPLFQYAWPNWRAGNIARNLGMFAGLRGLWSLLPLMATLLALGGALFKLARWARRYAEAGEG